MVTSTLLVLGISVDIMFRKGNLILCIKSLKNVHTPRVSNIISRHDKN